ncbi:hypothetical protein C1632_06165 [Microbacterium testaceum]|nr:hypothetical protein C1632_06165 [Microbacterium testaceum]
MLGGHRRARRDQVGRSTRENDRTAVAARTGTGVDDPVRVRRRDPVNEERNDEAPADGSAGAS